MTDTLKTMVSFLLLLALAGTASAAFGAATDTGTGRIVRTPETPVILPVQETCHFPLYNLPAYYVCVMGCKILGGGDSCPGKCENALSVCTTDG